MSFIYNLGAILVMIIACQSTPQKLAIQEKAEGFLFTEGRQKVLFYQRQPKSLEGKYTRSHYIHPLYGLDGEILTEDFPPDHLHQRGIFWAWHQIWINETRIADQWLLENFSWEVSDAHILTDDPESVALQLTVFWKSPLWLDAEGQEKPFIKENTTIRVYRATDSLRKVDFQIGLLALEKNLRIGGSEDEKGYGGFSARIRLPEDVRFSGQKGEVIPQNLSVEAGPWIDITGSFGEGKNVSGIAILCHPSLPGFPQPWILRSKKSMQNPVYPGREPVVLSQGEPLVLRYRIIIHRGKINIEKLQKEYTTE